MAYQVVWSTEAKQTYIAIIECLLENWSEKEVRNFADGVHSKLNLLSELPAIGIIHKKKYKIHRTLVHKNVSLIYHIRPLKNEIVLLTFWDGRQNPTKLKY